MAIVGLPEEERLKAVESNLQKMEALAKRMRELIIAQPPRDLLGYIYGQRLLRRLQGSDSTEQSPQPEAPSDLINDTQFLLEYVHAVLATTPEVDAVSLDEAACAELLQCSRELKTTAMGYAMLSSAGTENGPFGPDTADVESRAKSTWILLRGNRYQVLEGEFYAFVLNPHDTLLRETYGIGAEEIAAGFQDIADAVRVGYANAIQKIKMQLDEMKAFAIARRKPFKQVAQDWANQNSPDVTSVALAFDDMLRGGLCNVSRHTRLPHTLLADLAFERGEDSDFFANGPYSGTPFRTLPARKKPLIRLGGDYYAVDPCFIRDAGYRALLWNLLRIKPDYKQKFDERQKTLSERAFLDICDAQLKEATFHLEVYYKDSTTKQWVENDALILIDDVLMLVEAKAGAAATIASPCLDFARHVRAVQDLVIKAYTQCKRFFEYLNSEEEAPIFKKVNNRYVECDRLRRSDYRLMLPISLTVESFSPFSTMCKELPEITPILGKHAFFSLSIDELFVLKRFLPTMGELAHYLEVRQAVAAIKNVHLIDEFDHLGAYIKKNRFDLDLVGRRSELNAEMLIWDGMSEVVDRYFEQQDWGTVAPPAQNYPSEVIKLLCALDATRAPGWLSAESHIRNYGEERRSNLDDMLAQCRAILNSYPSRYFCLTGEQPLFVWLQREWTPINLLNIKEKATAAALAAKTEDIIALFVIARSTGQFVVAKRLMIDVPKERTAANSRIFEDAERLLR